MSDSKVISEMDIEKDINNAHVRAVEPVEHTSQSQAKDLDEVDLSLYHFTEEESRAVRRKFDLRILPMAWGMYLFNSLDRNNLSNAKSDGFTDQLSFPLNGYSTTLSVYYVFLCVCGIPGVALTRIVGPRWTLPGMMLGWGICAMVNAGTLNFASFLVVRGLLGAFEGPFASSLIFYLTTFYTRGELGMRVAVFYSCNALSGSFSGLLAYGIFQTEGTLHGWQILFLLEGGMTVLIAILAFFILPASPAKARFLNDREKEIARMRTLRDGSASVGTKFALRSFFKPLKDIRYWAFVVIAISYGSAGSAASTFLTQIIGRFGFSVIKTNLFTVAPYAAATVWLFIMAWSSDRARERGLHLASALVLIIIGAIMLAALPVDVIGPAYFATFLITMGGFTPSVLFHSWHQCNDPSEDGRAFRVGSLTFLANTGGFVSANIFRDQWAPHYVIPLIIIACIEGVGLVAILSLGSWMRWDNARRNKEQGVNWASKDVPTEALSEGPTNPLFRHFV